LAAEEEDVPSMRINELVQQLQISAVAAAPVRAGLPFRTG
jgi:hypothetical protein